MRFCPNCQVELGMENNADVCSHCGTKLQQNESFADALHDELLDHPECYETLAGDELDDYYDFDDELLD